jgi:hypothetical protein
MSASAIALVCDAGFLPYAAYLGRELDRTTPGRTFDIVIVGADLPALPRALDDIRIHRFEGENPFEHRDLKRRRSHASYLCLMLPELLPEYERVLYLDCDVAPNGGIEEVFGVDLRGQALGAVRDIQQWFTPSRRPAEFARAGQVSRRYLNSGVLLFDCHRWRAEGWTDACVRAAADPELALAYVRNDQSALNLALQGQWTELSPVWNWQWTERTRYFAEDAGARIIHFIGPKKPWRTVSIPPRFAEGYTAFLRLNFPEAAEPPRPDLRVNRHRRALLRHWLDVPAMQAFLDRFPDRLTTHPPEKP